MGEEKIKSLNLISRLLIVVLATSLVSGCIQFAPIDESSDSGSSISKKGTKSKNGPAAKRDNRLIIKPGAVVDLNPAVKINLNTNNFSDEKILISKNGSSIFYGAVASLASGQATFKLPFYDSSVQVTIVTGKNKKIFNEEIRIVDNSINIEF